MIVTAPMLFGAVSDRNCVLEPVKRGQKVVVNTLIENGVNGLVGKFVQRYAPVDHTREVQREKVMFMQVLVAPDKFKGSLSAQDAAAAIAEGWRAGSRASLDLEISCRPVADGGEGTAKVICEALGGSWGPVRFVILLADRSPRSTL